MPVVRRLSDDMINKIAAGEVVERPASVVKELVENALDAGATSVRVQVLGGGLRLIEVCDNGCGMSREDALLAVERHATSKIHSQEDLERIVTLGFRGEALPSIASVSRFKLLTRPAAELAGTELTIADGKMSCGDAASPAGTTIRVADLFYNTPARLKFMHSPRTEAMRIAETMEHLALTAPQVTFELLQDDRRQLLTSGSGKLDDVLLTLYGRQAARSWLPLLAEQDQVTLRGYVAKPELAKGNRAHEHFVVNGRYVQSRSLQHALEEAYRPLLAQKKYPLAVLLLELPLSQVDINVHPAKTEVRIQRDGDLHQFVLRAVRQALAQGAERAAESALTSYQAAPPAAVRPQISAEQMALPQSERQASGLSDFGNLTWSAAFAAPSSRRDDFAVRATQPAAEDNLAKPKYESLQQVEQRESIFPPFRIISQLSGTYILAQCASGWLIADQHAAHERILYQEMVDALQNGAIASQILLQPQPLRLTLREEALLDEHLEALQQLGFALEPFGNNTVLLRTVPHLLGESEGAEALRDILEQLQPEGKKPEALQIVQKALITLSCKAAIKANTWLPPGRMEELLQQLGVTEYAATCPHGRPTYWLLSIEELDRIFKRS